MTGTHKRIISAIVLGGAILSCILFGKMSTMIIIMIFGILSIHELEINFFKYRFLSTNYIISQLIFLASFVYFGFISYGKYTLLFVLLGIVQGFILLYYLFATKLESKKFIQLLSKIPLLSGIFIIIPFMASLHLLQYEQWVEYFLFLLVANFGMDTTAWFWGKTVGKRKLWPSISPQKTIAGFVGGSITTTLILCLGLYFLSGGLGLGEFLLSLLIPPLSQGGDLIQSKFKRQIGIKDSSYLIPGHGGVYDRIDSIMFTTPFMVFFLRFL